MKDFALSNPYLTTILIIVGMCVLDNIIANITDTIDKRNVIRGPKDSPKPECGPKEKDP